MDFIKRILLILILVLATFSFSEANCASIAMPSCECVLSGGEKSSKGFLNTKENELTLNVAQNSSTSINSRRNNNSESNIDDDFVAPSLKQFDNTISYIYTKGFLDDKNELALLLLLHQIQPNAP